jgi:hypothetical protein
MVAIDGSRLCVDTPLDVLLLLYLPTFWKYEYLISTYLTYLHIYICRYDNTYVGTFKNICIVIPNLLSYLSHLYCH